VDTSYAALLYNNAVPLQHLHRATVLFYNRPRLTKYKKSTCFVIIISFIERDERLVLYIGQEMFREPFVNTSKSALLYNNAVPLQHLHRATALFYNTGPV